MIHGRTKPPKSVPSVYLASKLHRAHWWREWQAVLSPSVINIISTWHESTTLAIDELDPVKCYRGWHDNRREISKADHLLAFGSKSDALNGTLVEIGMALAAGKSVHIVGTYPWGTWRHMPHVTFHDSLHAALCDITDSEVLFQVSKELLNDPD